MTPRDHCQRQDLLDQIWARIAVCDRTGLQAMLGERAPVAGIDNDPTLKRVSHLLEWITDRVGRRIPPGRAQRGDAGVAQKGIRQMNPIEELKLRTANCFNPEEAEEMRNGLAETTTISRCSSRRLAN
jgi:hypothetical protein